MGFLLGIKCSFEFAFLTVFFKQLHTWRDYSKLNFISSLFTQYFIQSDKGEIMFSMNQNQV